MSKKILFENLSHTQKVRILYKTILKLHRGLPEELRNLGNVYAHDEFKRHKNCNQNESEMFMKEWTSYALNLTKQLGLRGKQQDKIGKPLEKDLLDTLRDEQIVQLYELMNAATGKQTDEPLTNEEIKK